MGIKLFYLIIEKVTLTGCKRTINYRKDKSSLKEIKHFNNDAGVQFQYLLKILFYQNL